MARTKSRGSKRPIDSYEYKGKRRVSKPPVGPVTPDIDPDVDRRRKQVSVACCRI